jgi:hypothetical protein
MFQNEGCQIRVCGVKFKFYLIKLIQYLDFVEAKHLPRDLFLL